MWKHWPNLSCLVVMLSIVMPRAAASQSNNNNNTTCSNFEVEHGSTWLNLTWNLHCNSLQIPNIRRYIITLTDNTAMLYNYTLNDFCTEDTCTEFLDNIRPCINYTIDLAVEQYDDTKHSYEQVNLVMDEEMPTQPQLHEITGSNPTDMYTSWRPPKVGEYCVDHYQVCWDEISSQTKNETCMQTEELNAQISDLKSCNEYRVSVRAVTNVGELGHLSVVSNFTSSLTPGQPQNLRPYQAGSDFVSFYWNPSEENINCIRGIAAKCFEQEEQNIPFTFFEQKSEYSLSDISLVSEVSSLTPCTYYNCFAEVASEFDDWIVSEPFTFSTEAVDKLGSPELLAFNAEPYKITVFWTRPMEAARCVSAYYVSWNNKTVGQGSALVEKNVFSYEINQLEACVTYDIGIVAFTDGFGKYVNGSEASGLVKTLTAAPGPVLNLNQNMSQASPDDNVITMCWEPPEQNYFCAHDYRVTIFFGVEKIVQTFSTKTGAARGVEQCQGYQVEHCGRNYQFCVKPVTENGLEGPQVCTQAVSPPCAA